MNIASLGGAGGIGEEIIGVKTGAPQEPPAASMEIVGPRLRDDADYRAAVVAVLGGETVVQNREFL